MWRETYFIRKGEKWFDYGKEAIYEKLLKLDSNATAEDVKDIIGNDSWTNLRCDECETDGLDVIIQVGQEPDYDSSTVNLCIDCSVKATSLLKGIICLGGGSFVCSPKCIIKNRASSQLFINPAPSLK